VVVLLVGSAPALVRATVQAQGNGVIGGKANDEAKKPYTDYKVQLRDLGAAPPQVVATTTLDAQGRFTFNDLPLTKRYLVELYNVPKSKIVCTEGPYTLSTNLISKTDVNISCGGNPAAWWLLAAGAAAAAIAVGVRSPNG
jgi:hypothetical protein